MPTRPPNRRHRTPAAPSLLGAAALTLAVLLGPVAAAGAAEPPSPADAAGTAPATGAVIGAVSGPVTSANARYVADAYQTLLGRPADDAGLDYQLARLAAGGDRSREAMAWTLAFSTEGSRLEVDRAYSDLLGRAPDSAGATYWTAHLQGHGVVDLRVLLLASDELRLRSGGGTDTGWVGALYTAVLGRGPDSPGLQYWLGRLEAGVPPALVAASIYQSDEALGRRVQALYAEILGRAATGSEQMGGVATIRATDERNLRARLIASDEAFEPYLTGVLP
ncbi:MAG: DUF4214 domain-containing protein [Acidimicrobiia bacterium]|nr:DUF4214 domain-containing protein [Acidimicrobiia bacterium]